MLPVPQSERPHEWVAGQLRRAILDGTYSPGDRLPVERELSEHFKVSRSVVRQALLILDQQGLIRVKPGIGGGPFVARESLPAAITAFENLLTVDESSLTEFLEAKLVIEPAVAAHAAQRVSPEDLKRLEDNLIRTRQADERGEDITDLSVQFHSILFRCTGNRFMEVVLQILSRSFDRLPASSLKTADVRCVIDDHQEILDAIRNGAASAVGELMAAHVARVWSKPPMRSDA